MAMNLFRLTWIVLSHMLKPFDPDTSPCGKRRSDNFPKGDCRKPRYGRHGDPVKCRDRYWDDAENDDGVRCGDKRYPLGRR